MRLDPAQIFGRYTIECVLGEGGMGQVYRAADSKLLRRVALKVVTREAEGGGADESALVLREARAAAAITHENAVTIFDVGEVDGVPYIAMEYIEGASLRSFIGDASVSIDQRINWLVAIARALAAAHDKGLIHRDVKPENVMIRNDGTVKVLDFGIAHHRTLGSLRAIATTSSSLLSGSPDTQISGTPAYMAPEQLRGDPLDGRADQFAWGLVAYELLSGQHPTTSKNLAALIAERLTRTPRPLVAIGGLLPEPIQRAVARALEKEAADRFPSMNDLLSAIAVPESRPSLPRSIRPASALESAPTVDASPRVTDAPKSSRARLAIMAAVSISVAAASVAIARRPAATPKAPEATPVVVAVTDLPVPASARLDAVAEFKAGLQSARDGAGSEARVHFARAVEMDPTMASAHVWIAALTAFQSRSQARAALDRARKQRVSLSERDAALLAVLEPVLDRDPADLATAEQRALDATKRWPRDAHLRLQLAILRAARGERGALEDADAALALDAKYVAAALVRGLAFESFADDEAALSAYAKCVSDNPASASCFAGELKLLSRQGLCDRVSDEARRWTVSHPADPEAFRQRAIFLSAHYDSRDNVTELFATSRGLLPTSARARRETTDRLALALFAGDLPAAKTSAETLAANATDVAEHGEAALALVEIADELGNPAEAGRIALEFLRRRELWAGAARMDQDPTPVLAIRAQHAGLLPSVEADKVRDDWIERWASRGRNGERWVLAHAAGAANADDARRALAALPRFLPLPSLPDLRASEARGRVAFLGGRAEEAIPLLEAAVNDCAVIRAPIVHARALALLGDAYSARGDKAKACGARRRIDAMWTHAPANATPVTLEHARTAMKRDGC